MKRGLCVREQPVSLTRKEAAILVYFMLNQNRLVSAEELIAHVWNSDVDEVSNSIRVHLTTLRKN